MNFSPESNYSPTDCPEGLKMLSQSVMLFDSLHLHLPL
ncbi:hypothetical protein VULLAG_LOCUS17594 [Vulpes lagopus]